MLDIVAISALNLDYLAGFDDDPATRRAIAASCPDVRWGSEVAVDPDRFIALESILAGHLLPASLGGSGFNALRAARACSADLHLGIVGVIGNSGPATGFLEWFEANAIAALFVGRSKDLPSGSCLALEAGGERTLFTTRGANDCLSDILDDDADAVASWASQARIIHVSSFLDDRSPSALATFLAKCRDCNQGVQISIDPGAHWAARYHRDPSVRRLLDLATLMFVNQEEFDLLHGPGDTSQERCGARIALGAARAPEQTILKQPDRTIRFDAMGGVEQVQAHCRLTPDEIGVSTGAGDIFAGAYLAASLDPDCPADARLGMASAAARAALQRRAAKSPEESVAFAGRVTCDRSGAGA